MIIFQREKCCSVCADVAVSKCVEIEDVENAALGVVLQCLVELCVCSLVYYCFPLPVARSLQL